MNYEVTIGIPVYNVEKFIRLTMDSALAQTFRSIEFLVLDDCGTDSSMDIVREYQQTHPRGKDIRIVRQPQNGGLGRARNRIVKEAQGRYLYHLDADDAIVPNTIELLYANAQRYGADIVYGSYWRIEEYGEQTRRVPYQYPSSVFENEDEFAEFAYSSYDRLQCNNWNYLIDIAVLRNNSLKVPPVNYWEDLSFTMDFPTYIHCAVLLPDITYYYYCRKGSLSNFQKRDHIAKDEILKTIHAVNQNKDNTDRLRGKPYFPRRMYKLLMTDFYMVCTILKKGDSIQPAFSKREIRDIMSSPLSLGEILRFRQARMPNLFLFILSILPPFLSVSLMEIVGRKKRLI